MKAFECEIWTVYCILAAIHTFVSLTEHSALHWTLISWERPKNERKHGENKNWKIVRRWRRKRRRNTKHSTQFSVPRAPYRKWISVFEFTVLYCITWWNSPLFWGFRWNFIRFFYFQPNKWQYELNIGTKFFLTKIQNDNWKLKSEIKKIEISTLNDNTIYFAIDPVTIRDGRSKSFWRKNKTFIVTMHAIQSTISLHNDWLETISINAMSAIYI